MIGIWYTHIHTAIVQRVIRMRVDGSSPYPANAGKQAPEVTDVGIELWCVYNDRDGSRRGITGDGGDRDWR